MTFRYDMGITVGGVAIPDPSKWNYEVADLDLSGERDATGYLHRDRVATKINYNFEWNGLTWAMLQTVLATVTPAKFTLVAPDPRTFNTTYTGDYYVGNRSGGAYYYRTGSTEKAVFTLKMNLIQY